MRAGCYPPGFAGCVAINRDCRIDLDLWTQTDIPSSAFDSKAERAFRSRQQKRRVSSVSGHYIEGLAGQPFPGEPMCIDSNCRAWIVERENLAIAVALLTHALGSGLAKPNPVSLASSAERYAVAKVFLLIKIAAQLVPAQRPADCETKICRAHRRFFQSNPWTRPEIEPSTTVAGVNW